MAVMNLHTNFQYHIEKNYTDGVGSVTQRPVTTTDSINIHVENGLSLVYSTTPGNISSATSKITLNKEHLRIQYTVASNNQVDSLLKISLLASSLWMEQHCLSRSDIKLLISTSPLRQIRINDIEIDDNFKKLVKDPISSIGIHEKKIIFTILSRMHICLNKFKGNSITNQFDLNNLLRVKEIVRENCTNPPSIESLASEVNMSASKMQKMFKELFGIPIYQLALKYRMGKAKCLLETGKYSISQVGYAIGYSNLSHFAAKFKELVGVSPRDYTRLPSFSNESERKLH